MSQGFELNLRRMEIELVVHGVVETNFNRSAQIAAEGLRLQTLQKEFARMVRAGIPLTMEVF